MKIFHGFDSSETRGGYVSIGNFDGVHLGHQAMVRALLVRSVSLRVPAVVVTFEPHPIQLLRPGSAPPSITTLATRLERLRELGVERVIVFEPTRQFLDMTARDFFDHIICNELHALGLVEGANFCFGKNRAGTVAELSTWGTQAGLDIQVISPVEIDGATVSSSAIRRLISQGELPRATQLLGTHHQATGTVIRGAARGATIGFPTANLGNIETLLPPEGVYGGWGITPFGRYPAAINLGPNPTFGVATRKFEVHLLDFQGDLYGTELTVEFVARIRETLKFDSVESLLSQIRNDITVVRSLVQKSP